MRWLTERIREAGGQLEQRGIDGLGDLAEEGYDAIVVATGAYVAGWGFLGRCVCNCLPAGAAQH